MPGDERGLWTERLRYIDDEQEDLSFIFQAGWSPSSSLFTRHQPSSELVPFSSYSSLETWVHH